MFLLLCIISFLIILFTCYILKYRKNYAPGPWGIPILGYLPWINPEKPYETLTQLSRQYGSIYGLHLGGIYTVVLTDPRIIRKTLMKDVFSGRAPLYLTHGIMNGYGLICAEGDLWKDQRKFIHGCLRNFGATKNSLKRDQLEHLMQQGVQEFIQTIDEQLMTDNAINILSPLRHSLGNVINEFVFGCTWSSDDTLWNWLQILQEEGTKHIGVAGPVNFLPFLRFLPKYSRIINFLIEGKIKTHKVYQSIIDSHVKHTNSTVLETEEVTNIIDLFLIERKKREMCNDPSKTFYSDQQFYHLLADIFGASLDTTLTTLRWFFLFMAAFPKEQYRIQKELDVVLNGNLPKLENMASIPVLEAALAETQRIRSVVPIGIPHGSLEDTEIEGFFVPKGSMIIPLQWAVHMNPMYWATPELFQPDRFLNTDGRFYKPESFIPFQTGKRMCVGEDLAKMLLFLFAATVLQKYQIKYPVDETLDLTGDCGITLTPQKHVLSFVQRKI